MEGGEADGQSGGGKENPNAFQIKSLMAIIFLQHGDESSSDLLL